METVIAVVNLIASCSIIVLTMIQWKRWDEYNCIEKIGYNIMAIFCAAVVIKAGYNLSLHEFRSDAFGIATRVGVSIAMLGNSCRHMTIVLSKTIWEGESAHREQVHC